MAGKADIQFDIRPVDPLDEKAVAEFSRLHVAAFEAQNENGWTARSVQSSLESPGTKGFLFITGDVVVGVLMVRTVCDEAELITVAVQPNQQSQGVGRRILSFMLEFLRQENITTCFLEVRKDNAKAVSLYEQAGFIQVGVRSGYYQNQEGKRTDAALYSLDLFNKK